MKLNIIYSIDYNIERVKDTIDKIDWFNEKGYTPTIPKKLIGADLKKIIPGDVEKAVTEEYDENWHKEIGELLRNGMKEYIPILTQAFINASLSAQEEYEVKLTQYGTGGSYTLPNLIILNISKELNIDPIKTTLHEMIHLSIEPLIEQYDIDHWKKERLVDRMLYEIFPRLTKRMQNINAAVIAKVDEAFDAYYPDIEKICKELKN